MTLWHGDNQGYDQEPATTSLVIVVAVIAAVVLGIAIGYLLNGALP